MAYCTHCATPLPQEGAPCPNCCATQQVYYTPAAPQKRKLNVLWLVLSIVNIVLLGNGVGLVLGAIGLVFTILASQAVSDEQEALYLKIAKILNIIGLGFLGLGLLFLIGFFATRMAGGILSGLIALIAGIVAGIAGMGDFAQILEELGELALLLIR